MFITDQFAADHVHNRPFITDYQVRIGYPECAVCAHTLWNSTWRDILQIVRSRQNHKRTIKIIMHFPVSSPIVCAICMYSTALVFEENLRKLLL